MKKQTLCVWLIFLFLSSPLFSQGEPESFRSPSDAKIAELQEMHEAAEEKIAMNKLDEAIEIYTGILLYEGDDDVAYANRGHIHMILGNYGKAKEDFRSALDINPENETARLGLRKIADPDGFLAG